ncbi:MAG: 50S ribosomal protein L23 [Paludibacteraceae bacterium]|jgi:Ribosomal protein L23|nr:50S ribosomal protein L23 [Paludibacteraceae bacterium]
MGIIIKPIITEKMTNLSEKYSRYGFRVVPTANKLEIKKAVEEMYNVKVASVNTARVEGKAKSRYTKTGILSGRDVSYKKAYVTLKEGEVIDFYSNIE